MAELRLLFLILVTGLLGCNDESSQEKATLGSGNLSEGKSRIQVAVGVANACQQPLTFEDGSGLSRDIINELNSVQSKFEFTHQLLPTKRLESLADDGKLHVAAFSNLAWSWDKSKVKRSTKLVSDKDVFFALKKEGRDESFFDDMKARSKIGVNGFHYTFIDPSLSVKEISEKLFFTGVQSEKAVIDMILLERGEVGVVSILTLQYLLISDPDKYSKLLISQKYDSEYDRYYVLMEKSPINVDEFNSLLSLLRKNGRLNNLLVKYGLAVPVIAGK